jgi:hypothetical protein
VNVPDHFTFGEVFGVRIGLYNPAAGTRFLPEGTDDGTRRIHLGVIELRAEGVRFTVFEPGPDPWLDRMNPTLKPIAFEDLVTNAAVRITRSGGSTWVTPLPGSRPAQVRFRPGFTPVEVRARDERGAILDAGPPVVEGGDVLLTIGSNVFTYELR